MYKCHLAACIRSGHKFVFLLCRYAIMKDCWSQIPSKRPSFTLLVHRLASLSNRPEHNIYLDQMEDNIYDIIDNLPGEKC